MNRKNSAIVYECFLLKIAIKMHKLYFQGTMLLIQFTGPDSWMILSNQIMKQIVH